VICTLDEGAEIRMEFTVNTGKGYVPADRNRPEDAPIGLIPVDSLYSPVRRVSYKVENTREGQVLDYRQADPDVETDGSSRRKMPWLTPRASCRISFAALHQLRRAERKSPRNTVPNWRSTRSC
jgi:DNA-directed RNA polymerase alpha subunit